MCIISYFKLRKARTRFELKVRKTGLWNEDIKNYLIVVLRTIKDPEILDSCGIYPGNAEDIIFSWHSSDFKQQLQLRLWPNGCMVIGNEEKMPKEYMMAIDDIDKCLEIILRFVR